MSSINSCSEKSQGLQKKIEEATGVCLPDSSFITSTKEGAIVATSTNAQGTMHMVEINEKGVFHSTYCSKEDADLTMFRVGPYGEILSVPGCKDTKSLKMSGPIDPQKLVDAREILLGNKVKLARKIKNKL